jgi:phosphoribosyl-ATP pyrophosphohydrolase/phosphoribosyl-AMP cyclohydrolase
MKIDWQKGLIPAIIQHHENGNVLMLGFMNNEAFELTQSTKLVHFFSRSKNRIWMKGETSGNTLEITEIITDCDYDTILIKAKPFGPICHTGSNTCFGEYKHFSFLSKLEDIIKTRVSSNNEQSYVKKLVDSGANRVAQKVGEEGVEVVIASIGEEEKLIDESADLLFHLMILLQTKGLSIQDVILRLKQRNNKYE